MSTVSSYTYLNRSYENGKLQRTCFEANLLKDVLVNSAQGLIVSPFFQVRGDPVVSTYDELNQRIATVFTEHQPHRLFDALTDLSISQNNQLTELMKTITWIDGSIIHDRVSPFVDALIDKPFSQILQQFILKKISHCFKEAALFFYPKKYSQCEELISIKMPRLTHYFVEEAFKGLFLKTIRPLIIEDNPRNRLTVVSLDHPDNDCQYVGKEVGGKERLQCREHITMLRFANPSDQFVTLEAMHGKVMVLEYLKGGDLFENSQILETATIPKLLLPVVSCMSELASQGYIHGDIKLENIFLDETGRSKLGDLGFCHNVHKERETRGTRSYVAFELFEETPQGISLKSDIFSLGITMVELLCNRLPEEMIDIPNQDNLTFEEKITLCRTLFRVAVYSQIESILERNLLRNRYRSLIAITAQCLSIDPNKRPSLDEIRKALETCEQELEQSKICRRLHRIQSQLPPPKGGGLKR
ncbi:MAG: protein kinase [Chlamydiota bacterium]